MELLIIALLIFVGVLLMIAEIFLLPGVSVAAILSIISFVAALFFSYEYFSVIGFIVTIVISFVLLGLLFYISMRNKNLKRMSLEEVIDSKVSENADQFAVIGDKVTTKTRLNPIGSIVIDGRIFEAKSFTGLIEQKKEVEIVGFEDSIVVVKQINK